MEKAEKDNQTHPEVAGTVEAGDPVEVVEARSQPISDELNRAVQDEQSLLRHSFMLKRPPACSFVRATRGVSVGNEIARIEPRESLMA